MPVSSSSSMKVTIDYLDEFARGAKALRKKYPSFESDYETFLDELEKNPFSGESLGQHTYKNRMAIASKGKGKSGGARVITYNVQQQSDDDRECLRCLSAEPCAADREPEEVVREQADKS